MSEAENNSLGEMFKAIGVNPCTDDYKVIGGCGVVVILFSRGNHLVLSKRLKFDTGDPGTLVPFEPLKLKLDERQALAYRLHSNNLKINEIAMILGVGSSTVSNDVRLGRDASLKTLDA